MARKFYEVRPVRAAMVLVVVLALGAAVARTEDPPRPAPRGGIVGPLPGSQASTSVFGIVGEGSRFVYVFDRSGSMDDPGGRPLKAAKEELLDSLGRLGDVQQFYIIFYNEAPRAFVAPTGRGRLVFANESNRKSATDFVDSIQADGGTNHYDALLLAVKLRPDVIFLLTDGEEKDDLTAEQLERLKKLNDGVAAIQVIQFTHGTKDAGASLAKLAEQNRGQHVAIDVTKLK